MKRWDHRSRNRRLTAAGAGIVAFLAAVGVSFRIVALLADWIGQPTPFGRTVSVYVQGALLALSLVGAYLLARRVHALCLRNRVGDAAQICGNCGYNLTGNVSGRCPECGMDSVTHVAWHLAGRESHHRLKVGAMFLFGVPLSLGGPVVVATMFWFAAKLFSRSGDFFSGLRWLDLFVGLSMVMVPLLYHLELRTNGGYRADLSKGAGGPTRFPALRATIFGPAGLFVDPRPFSTALVECFLSGPRLVISALHRRRLAARLRLRNRTRAAEVVASLLARDEGVETHRILKAGETVKQLLPALAYLAFYQWTGVGENWQRVWLHSEARRVLSG